MRDEKGVWCDTPGHQSVPATTRNVPGGGQEVVKPYKQGKTAVNILTCQIEQSEFALCRSCQQEWIGKTHGKPEQQIRCPRCLPRYLESRGIPGLGAPALPPPIEGPLATAFSEAMYAEGILKPTITRVLQRMAANEDQYIKSLLRTVTPDYEDSRAI